MKKLFLSLALTAGLGLQAAEVNVTTGDFADAYAAAADGDVLVLAEGSYGGQLTFPSGKTITLKAADGAAVDFLSLFRANDASLTDGGIILEGLDIHPTDSYFINLDNYGHIKTITVKDCSIHGIGRCFLRTNSTGNTIDEIIFENCLIYDCGSGGWNFMYPKHIVKKVDVSNSTLYNYTNGESLFKPNAKDESNAFVFSFTNNTVYRWGKSNDRALAKVEGNYGAGSVYTLKDNIIYKGGADNITPYIVHANAGSLVAKNNLVVDYGDYNMGGSASKDINDLTLTGLGMESLSFPDADNGDFTIVSSSPLATASTADGIIGDPRWLKTVSAAANFTAAASPAEGGTVAPAQAVYEVGEQVTVTATAAYGYRFASWQDAAGTVLSTENPYTFEISKDTDVKAVFTAVETYTLKVNLAGDGAKWGKVSFSPEPVNGIYEAGTEVVVSVVPNSVTNFLNWEDGSADKARSVTVNEAKELTATFDVIPFIVAWDFAASEPRSNRPGDYAFASDNLGLLDFFNGDGTRTNWGGSQRDFGTGSVNCARRYTNFSDMDNPRYFVARFNAEGYSNIRVHSNVAADNDCVHSVQKIQISTDGTEYTDLKTVTIENKNQWITFDAQLPENLGVVYVRWIGDTSSPLLGTPGANDTEGFYLSDVVIYADQKALNDDEAPVLVSSSPADGSDNASANGNFVLSFNERVKAGNGAVTLNGVELEGVFGSKTVTYAYKGLDYGTQYTLEIERGAITDLSGNEFAGTQITFTTFERPVPEAHVFNAVVAKDGTGDYTSVQAAVDAAPTGRIAPWLIFVKNGEYEELVKISNDKPFIHLIGQDKAKTIIKYWINNGGSSDIGWEYSTNNPSSKTYGYSGVVQVDASDFYTENITYLNSYGVERQAGPMGLAMKSSGDRQAFYNCNFRSYQDTWYTDVKSVANRHYVNKCMIEGAVDYFYGSGDVYVENSTFMQARETGSVVFAPAHKAGTKYGYVIESCLFDGPGSNHKLGRAWQNEPIAVLLNNRFKAQFAAEGWSEWHIAPKIFAEYNSMDDDGNPIDLTGRRNEYKVDGQTEKTKVNPVLTAEEAARYTYKNVTSGTDDWNPRKLFEAVAAPANVAVGSDGTLSWDASDYAICYIVIDGNENVVAITKDTNYAPVAKSRAATDNDYVVKAVNEYGSLSAPGKVGVASGIGDASVEGEVVSRTYYDVLGHSSDRAFDGVNIVVDRYDNGKTSTYKIIK